MMLTEIVLHKSRIWELGRHSRLDRMQHEGQRGYGGSSAVFSLFLLPRFQRKGWHGIRCRARHNRSTNDLMNEIGSLSRTNYRWNYLRVTRLYDGDRRFFVDYATRRHNRVELNRSWDGNYGWDQHLGGGLDVIGHLIANGNTCSSAWWVVFRILVLLLVVVNCGTNLPQKGLSGFPKCSATVSTQAAISLSDLK